MWDIGMCNVLYVCVCIILWNKTAKIQCNTKGSAKGEKLKKVKRRKRVKQHHKWLSDAARQPQMSFALFAAHFFQLFVTATMYEYAVKMLQLVAASQCPIHMKINTAQQMLWNMLQTSCNNFLSNNRSSALLLHSHTSVCTYVYMNNNVSSAKHVFKQQLICYIFTSCKFILK